MIRSTRTFGFTLIELFTMRKGFTLIELLVVVTIIVVLIAMLIPAMEKAIYQAELTVCATRHRGVGAGVTRYALNNRRRYPYRRSTDQSSGAIGGGWAQWIGGASQGVNDDSRLYAPYFSVNKTLNCPLITQLNFEKNGVYCTFNLWFGFAYHNDSGFRDKGLFKMGDRLEWNDTSVSPTRRVTSSLLSGTRYIAANGELFLSGTHPDQEGKYYLSDSNPDAQVARWDSTDTSRGPVDLNFGFADLSVQRFNQVEWDDNTRMVHVPGYTNDGGGNNNYEIIPKQ